ncbi:MAG: hypothetical protein ACRC16_22050 [Aeromonas salmonicida]
MTRETYYRRDEHGEYQPVSYYDSNFMDAMPEGCHLVSVYPGGSCGRYNVNPDQAGLLAALTWCREAAVKSLVDAQQLKPSNDAITEEQRLAWQRMLDAFPEGTYGIRPSCQEAVDKMANLLVEQVERMLDKNPQLRSAHARFQALVALSNAGSE